MQIMVSGQLIGYKDEGKGRTIVMLHGWGSNLATFDSLASHLSKRFHVVRLDFPGFGSSSKPTDNWGVGEYAQLVNNVISKLKLDNLYGIIGHSFGGRVIIKGIANNYFQPQKVVLIGTAGVKPPRSAMKSIYKSIAKAGKVVTMLPGLKSMRPALRKKLYGAAGASDYLNAGSMQQVFLNTINEDLLPDVHRITQPTLLIWGENDNETPVADAQKIMHELPDGQLIVIPDAGHFVYNDDQTAVIKELDAFL
ncbi:MAG: alpha/beta hydrolase family protein [Candidatus Saccharibacteria bacterium]|nr:alpha/beta hydrolase family protein [Candidatus Saccharibacteria bacterium]